MSLRVSITGTSSNFTGEMRGHQHGGNVSEPKSHLVRLWANCRNCTPRKPRTQSLEQWSRTAAGLTNDGMLIWCKRCDMMIAHFTPETLREMLESNPKGERCECCPGGVHTGPS